MGRFVSKGNVVFVKPNIAWDRRPEQAACTNPDVVAALVEMCFQAGAKRVAVSDNPCNSAQRTFPRSGIQSAAEKAGAQCYFMDERKFRKMAINGARVLKEWEIYRDVVEADRVINVGIVKQHSLTGAVLGMKNLMGVAGGARNRFHQDIANTVADLAGFIKPQLVVLDAVRVLAANGPDGRQPGRRETPRHHRGGRGPGGDGCLRRHTAGPRAAGYRLSFWKVHARGLGNMNLRRRSRPRAWRCRWLAKRERRRWCGCAAPSRPRSCCCFSTSFWKPCITPSTAWAAG